MGLGTAVGLGLAMAAPDESVWTFEADGGLLMNLGVLGVVAKLRPPNLRLVVFDNESYHSGGRMETLTSDTVDLAAVGTACGLRHVATVRDADAFAAAAAQAAERTEPSLIVAKVDTTIVGPPLTMEYVEIKQRFVRDMERKLGLTILRPAEQISAP
jgi:thiamine pyrophosphate-dependent acetolactate synthase large subunit-like protein